MTIIITDEFKNICREILEEHKQLSEWAKIESDDMFQTPNFAGGFDATENAFCFSYYDPSGAEFWFQVTLDEITAIVNGAITTLNLRAAE